MDQKRELVRAFSAEYEISTLCEVLGLARSSYYSTFAERVDIRS